MPAQVALLRGINLGPNRRVSMPALRVALEDAGFGPVATYLQSGNVVLDSAIGEGELVRECERVIAETFKLQVDVVVRTGAELAAVVERNPLGDVAKDPKRYQVSFLARELDRERLEALIAVAAEPERLVAIGRELYGWHPDGVARSKLWGRLAGPGLGVTATARNWTTVTKLLELARGRDS